MLYSWYQEEMQAGRLQNPSDFLRHRQVQRATFIVAIVLVPLAVVNFFWTERTFETADAKLEQGNKINQPALTAQGYRQKLEEEPYNIPLHMEWIEFAATTFGVEDRNILSSYQTMVYSGDTKKLFIGQLGSGLFQALKGNVIDAQNTLNAIPDPNQPYVNYALGILHQQVTRYDLAEEHYRREIELEGNVKGAYHRLSLMWHETNNRVKLLELLSERKARQYVSPALRKRIFFDDADVIGYAGALFDLVTKKITLLGFIAALLVMLAWLLYIRRLDVFEPEPWLPILLVLGTGALFAYLVFPISDFIQTVLDFTLNGDPGNDFFYCWLAIGVPEELVKILPVLLLLRFSKHINEPYDYILYGSVAALGFAFSENMLYYQEGDLDNISGRALYAVVSHMFDTSVICYGMLLNRYKLKRNPYINFVFFFLLASIAHGFYDFWLINEWAQQFAILTVLFFLFSIHVWVLFKNNALNNSTFFNPKTKIDNQKIKFTLIASLVGIVMLEYLFVAYQADPEQANINLSGEVMSTGLLVVYLATNFSRFKLQRGRWNKLKLPFRWNFSSFSEEDSDHTGLKIKLYNAKENHTQIIGLPAAGRLIERKTVNGNAHWYLVQFDLNLGYPDVVQNMVLIHAKNQKKAFEGAAPCPVEVLLIPSHSLLLAENIDSFQLRPMGTALALRNE